MKLVKPSLSDIIYVCRQIRESDRRELMATCWEDDLDELAVRVFKSWGNFIWVAGTDEPIAILGMSPMWPGVWGAFMFATDKIHQIGLPLTRAARTVIIPAVLDTDCHRIEARSVAGHHEAHRWLGALGFHEEAVLRRYGKGGEDFKVFVHGRGG